MSLSQFIRDNTNDGRNIASVLIDVMEGRLDDCRDPECEFHGDPPDIVLDPNDYHY